MRINLHKLESAGFSIISNDGVMEITANNPINIPEMQLRAYGLTTSQIAEVHELLETFQLHNAILNLGKEEIRNDSKGEGTKRLINKSREKRAESTCE